MAEEDGRESLLRNDRDGDIALRSSSVDFLSSDEESSNRPKSPRTRRRNTGSRSKGDYAPLGDPASARQRRRGFIKFSLFSRRCCIITGVVIGLLFLIGGGGGFWVYKKRPSDGQSPPWYPSPLGGTLTEWEKSYEQAKAMVEKMTLPEKVNVTTGVGVCCLDTDMHVS